MNKSQIDDLFFEIYGYYPNKAGQAYEMIVNAAIKIVYGNDVEYNLNQRGKYSNTVYQLDGMIQSDSQNMVEAKDYTIDNRRVGRGDVQKLQGAITDLDVNGGIFASATDFTKPAKKYAESSKENPLQKEIKLLHVRPSTEEDEKFILQRVEIRINVHMPLLKQAKFDLIFTEESLDELAKKYSKDGSFTYNISDIYNKNGDVLITISDLCKIAPIKTTDEKGLFGNASWVIRDGYFKFNEELYQIRGITYEIPFGILTKDLIIEMEGTFKIYFKNEDGTIDKLLTDADLKKIKFENGKVIRKETFNI